MVDPIRILLYARDSTVGSAVPKSFKKKLKNRNPDWSGLPLPTCEFGRKPSQKITTPSPQPVVPAKIVFQEREKVQIGYKVMILTGRTKPSQKSE
jgi:hypothetical protein